MEFFRQTRCEICKKYYNKSIYSLSPHSICPTCLENENLVEKFIKKKEKKLQKKKERLREELDNLLLNPSEREKVLSELEIEEIIKQEFLSEIGRFPTEEELIDELERWKRIGKKGR